MDCVKKTYKNEGFRGFYKGLLVLPLFPALFTFSLFFFFSLLFSFLISFLFAFLFSLLSSSPSFLPVPHSLTHQA